MGRRTRRREESKARSKAESRRAGWGRFGASVGLVAFLAVAAVVVVAGVMMWRSSQGPDWGTAPGQIRGEDPGAPEDAGEPPSGDRAISEFRELCTAASGYPRVTAIAWRADGAQIAAGHADGSVSIWDSTAGAHVVTIRGTSDQAVDSLSWSPGGQLLAAAHRRDHMTVWDSAEAAVVWEVDGGGIYAVVGWTEDGRSVKTYNGEEYCALWNVDSRTQERSWFVSIAEQGEVISPDGTLAAWESMAEGRWTVHRTDWQADSDGEREWELVGHRGPIHGVSWKADSQELTGATDDGVAVWSATNGRLVRSMSVPGQRVIYVAWSLDADGRWILAGCDGGASVVLDAYTGRRLAEVSVRGRDSSAWDPQGEYLATIGADGIVHLYQEESR